MGGVILAMIIPGIIATTQMLLALIAASDLWKQSNDHAPGPTRTTLRWLALALAEPAVNGVLITILFLGPLSPGLHGVRSVYHPDIARTLRLTASMAVLLAPLLWSLTSDAFCRRVLVRLGALGALRWTLTVLIFMEPLLVGAGLIVLGFSIWWVKRQGAAISVRYHAIGLGPQGVMVGEFDRDDQPGISF
jgi:hypothetical protein